MKGTGLELKLWRWQRTSALILLPLVAFHLIFQYALTDAGGISFAGVSARLSLVVFLLVDILLLLSVTTHALLGLRSILMDYSLSAASARRSTAIILAALAVLVIYGLSALFAFR